MTAHVEVKNRTAWEWNKVLLSGFEVWRKLRNHGGGIVRGNLEKGTLEFTLSAEEPAA